MPLKNLRIAMVASLVLALAIAPVSYAGNVLGHRAGTNSTVTFDQVSLTSTIHSAFDFNDINNIEPTQISTTLYHGSGGKEVNVFDANYGDTGWAGRYLCVQGDGNTCEEGWVQINLYWSYTTTQARSLVCEEVGHSVGLAHSSQTSSCMSQQWDRTFLSSHDMGELNNIY